jgi:hypothetical protein
MRIACAVVLGCMVLGCITEKEKLKVTNDSKPDDKTGIGPTEPKTPEGLEKEFTDDFDAFSKKYISTEQGKIDGKPMVKLTGECKSKGNNHSIRTPKGTTIILQGVPEGKGTIATGEGKIIKADKGNKTIIIDCKAVQLTTKIGNQGVLEIRDCCPMVHLVSLSVTDPPQGISPIFEVEAEAGIGHKLVMLRVAGDKR